MDRRTSRLVMGIVLAALVIGVVVYFVASR